MEKLLQAYDPAGEPPPVPLEPSTQNHKKRQGNEPHFEMRQYRYEIFGTDLTQMPAISTLTVSTLLTEVGPDFSKFRSAGAFCSWLGRCPQNEISGGKVLATGTRKVKNRAAKALRLAAPSRYKSPSALGAYYRRMRAKFGAPKAITAAAHKLARIIYNLVTTRQHYNESVFLRHDDEQRRRAITRLKSQAKVLGLQLVAVEGVQ